jgi:hypothetical protein
MNAKIIPITDIAADAITIEIEIIAFLSIIVVIPFNFNPPDLIAFSVAKIE